MKKITNAHIKKLVRAAFFKAYQIRLKLKDITIDYAEYNDYIDEINCINGKINGVDFEIFVNSLVLYGDDIKTIF